MDGALLIGDTIAEDAPVVSGALVGDILVGDLDALTEGFAFLEGLGL